MNSAETRVAQALDKANEMAERYGVEIPPRVFREMGGTIVDYVRNRSMRVTFPVRPEYAGPTGAMQGGMIAAAFDNAFGPFCYLVAKRPCLTVSMETSYMRTVPTDEEGTLVVEVRLRAKTRTLLFLEAEAFNGGGKLVATAKTSLTMVTLPSNGAAPNALS
ncbi:MAG: PaaI family thioesterase [bacterium]|nr:PaaI family thioesterase [bacterium]